MLDGDVRWKKVLEVEVYDLAHTDGPRGRGEASILGVELHPDRDGVVAKFDGFEENGILIPTAVIKAATKIAGKA